MVTNTPAQLKKKIFFIHVGKTAGSSFNVFLGNHFNGKVHCERFLMPDQLTLSNLEELQELDYISGHLKLGVFAKNGLSRDQYCLVTFLRNPMGQVLSHMNWIMHIYDRGTKFFESHPQAIQEISHELRAADLRNPDVFITTLNRYRGLFQNNQSRYFIEYEKQNSKDAIEQISQLDLVGITEYYEPSLQAFISLNDMNLKPMVHQANRNSNYRIGKEVLENVEIFNFLKEYNSVDIEVYDYFLKKFRQTIGLEETAQAVQADA